MQNNGSIKTQFKKGHVKTNYNRKYWGTFFEK